MELGVPLDFREVVIGKDVCAGRSEDRLAQILARSDDGFLAAVAEKTQHGFDFGAHVSRREMAGSRVVLQLRRGDLPQRTLRGLLVIQVHVVGVSGNNEQIGAETGSQQRGGAVLVDDGFHALQSPVLRDDGNASASARDDDHALLDQISNDLQFNNFNRLR